MRGVSLEALAGPHRRYNPLVDEWVLVSADRTSRPWQGSEEAARQEIRPTYDPSCYLCPGNARAGGTMNPSYEQTTTAGVVGGLLIAEGERETCRVVCFSPRHDLTLARISRDQVREESFLAIHPLPPVRQTRASGCPHRRAAIDSGGTRRGCNGRWRVAQR